MEGKTQKPEVQENQEYTIKFIPKQGGSVKSLRLPVRLLKYGAGSLAVLSMLFVGAVSYSVYSTFAARDGAAEITDLRAVNGIQQEQLLQLSKKANALQDEVDQLTELEQQLRRQTGAAPMQDTKAAPATGETKHDGQGGPYVEPNLANVTEALSQVEMKLAERRESLLDLKEQIRQRQEKLGTAGAYSFTGPAITTPCIWPCQGDVSSPYGLRWGGTDFHPGIDIANDMGTPIVATADGVVTTAGYNMGGYGNMVDIDHGNGVMTRYGHGSQVVVTAGQHVKRGQVIMYMGSTGFSTGPHCHYEVRVNGEAVNPASYL